MSKFGKELIASMTQAAAHARGRKGKGLRITKVRLTKELLATAKDMRDIGAMSKETYEKISLRHRKGVPKV